MFVYNKLCLKQVYGDFPGLILNNKSAEAEEYIYKKKTWLWTNFII